jgi:hypothetical protein
MKRILLIALLVTATSAITASAQTTPAGPPAGTPGVGAGANFVDADGDGICDNFQTGQGAGRRAQAGKRGGYGPGDGTGRQGIGPRDGTGYGPGAQSGNCTGAGPQGNANRGRGRRQ